MFFSKIKRESRAYSFKSNLDSAANFFELLFYFFPKLAFDLLNIRLRWLAWCFAIARANSGFELMVGLLYFAKRNGTKRNEIKRNEIKRNEMERNEMGNLYFAKSEICTLRNENMTKEKMNN